MLLHQLRNIRKIILRSLQEGGEMTPRDFESLHRLVGILEMCDGPPEDVETARSQLRSLRDSGRISVDAVMSLEDAVTQCERELLIFTSEASSLGAEVVDGLEPLKRTFLRELDEVSADTLRPGDEGLVDMTKNLIYSMPGMYIKEIHEALNLRYSKVTSYTSVRRCVGELERRQEALTIGGPQGAFRYCFPDPHRIADREEYYGGPFAISGEVEKRVTLSWTQHSTKRLRDLFIVNSSNPRRTLLIVDYRKIPQLDTPGTSIVSFGKLEDVDYVLPHEGLVAPKDVDEVDDVLVGLKVDIKVNGEAEPVWFDKELLGRRSFYA